jgi:hypothetical protein
VAVNTPILKRLARRARLPGNTAGSGWRWLQRAVGMVLVLFLVLAVLGRTVGLPEAWKQRLVRELSSRGVEVEVKKLTIDPLGGLVARDLVVFRDGTRKEERLRVRRVELTPNWQAWRAEEPFLAGARLRDVHVSWPLGEGVEAEARRVEADLEFRPGEIRIQRLRGQVLGLDLDLKGRIGTEAGRQAAPREFPMAKAWRQAETVLQDLGGTAPKIQAEFSVEAGRPEVSQAEILVTSARNIWRGVAIASMEVRATMAEGMFKLERFGVELEKGSVEVQGWADLGRGAGGAEFFGAVDPAQLAPALGPNAALAVREFRSQERPKLSGKAEAVWKGEPSFFASAQLEVGEFRLGLFPFRSLHLPWVTDGTRWMVQGFRVEAASGGGLEAQVAFDGKADLKGHLRSDLDLKGLAPLFGAGAAPFWSSLEFAKPPELNFRILGAGFSPELIRLEGKVQAEAMRYKGVPLDTLTADVVYAAKEIRATNVRVTSGGGEGKGELRYTLEPRFVYFHNVESTLPVREFSPVFGEKVRETMQPYEFVDRPFVTLEGKIDLEEKFRTEMTATGKSSAGLHYVVAGKKLHFREVNLEVKMAGKKTTVKTQDKKPGSLWGGRVEVDVVVDGPKGEKTQKTKVQLEEVDFGKTVEVYFGNPGYNGKLSGTCELEGPSGAGTWRQWTGRGELEVARGKFPGLGNFAKAINAPLEWMNDLGEGARMEFRLAGGKLEVERLKIFSKLVETTGEGFYDIAEDRLEKFSMKQNLIGPVGVPFMLVSEMLEVEGSGSLKAPVWTPKNFDGK